MATGARGSMLRSITRSALFLGTALGAPAHLEGAELYDLTGRWEEGAAAVVAIGAFDGVHVGHRALVAEAEADARRRGVPLVIITFDPDPAFVLAKEHREAEILSSADRLLGLSTLGPDAIVAFHFDEAFAAMGYEEFFTERLLGLADVLAVHVGEDFALGRGGQGTLPALQVLAGALGVQLFGHELVEVGGEPVSATRIRALLDEGAIRAAYELIGRYPFVRGRVEWGRGEGHGLGIPTANVHFGERYAFPREGVFMGIVSEGSMAWPAAVNLGNPPSFDSSPLERGTWLAEASLLGFDGDLYDRGVSVVLVERLRTSRKFEREDELVSTIKGNLAQVEHLLGGKGERVVA